MPHSGKTVLIVEDDSRLRYLLEAAARRCLRFSEVTLAADGKEALELLRKCKTGALPDLIVTDLSMPRLSGLELLAAVKSDARTRSIPVAILTSSDAPNDRARAMAAGACSFVAKPFGVEALAHALGAICDACSFEAGATASSA